MAPQASAVSALRAITFRISSATKAELPQLVAYLSQSLLSCKDLLSSPENLAQKDSDAAVVLNRFNTQISTLLQDRTPEGRWAAVVLVKASIESGGWETLRKSNAWVRGLLAILKKPDPPITRCLATITLTRIFMLTWDYPTLIREITTPALPTFVSTCLNNLAARPDSQDELRCTLESFAQLLPRHPTIFRSNQDAVAKVLQTIFETPKSSLPTDLKDLACRVSVLLHQCEPKGGAGDKWERSLVSTVKATHAMADKTFMSIEEDWQSVAGNNISKHSLTNLYRASQESKDASGRPVQQFVVSGSEALFNNLRVLATYFSIATPANVVVSVGQVTDLLTRLLAVTISQSASRTSVKFNRDSSREERDALTQVLPEIHLAALELLSTLLARYGNQLTATLQSFIDQLLWIFHAESSNRAVKTAVYTVMNSLINLAGPAMIRETVASLRRLILACCEDLLPSQKEEKSEQSSSTTPGGSAKPTQGTMNADTFLKQPKTSTPSAQLTQFPSLHQAARILIPTLLSRLPAKYIPVAVRSQLDRTAVIIRHKEAMVASTLNPPATEGGGKSANSLLPLLAREHASESAVEALLRPRMPVIETGRRATTAQDGGNEEDDDEVENEEEVEAEDDDDDDNAMDVDEETKTSTVQEKQKNHEEEEEEREKDGLIISDAMKAYTSSSAAASDAKVHVLGKRTRSPDQVSKETEGEDKRRRSSPSPLPASVSGNVPTSVLVGDIVTTMPASATADQKKKEEVEEDEDDDDDAFEIPQLVMDADSDDDDE